MLYTVDSSCFNLPLLVSQHFKANWSSKLSSMALKCSQWVFLRGLRRDRAAGRFRRDMIQFSSIFLAAVRREYSPRSLTELKQPNLVKRSSKGATKQLSSLLVLRVQMQRNKNKRCVDGSVYRPVRELCRTKRGRFFFFFVSVRRNFWKLRRLSALSEILTLYCSA